MRYYEASSIIASSPKAVWAILEDEAGWPSWDSGVERVEGRTAPCEEYNGPLLGLIWRSMPDLRTTFERFAHGLKRRVETGA
jgi:hypothetical protein